MQWRSHWGGKGEECHPLPWQRKICQKSGKRVKNQEKSGRKGKNLEGFFSLCPSWQIGLATLLARSSLTYLQLFVLRKGVDRNCNNTATQHIYIWLVIRLQPKYSSLHTFFTCCHFYYQYINLKKQHIFAISVACLYLFYPVWESLNMTQLNESIQIYVMLITSWLLNHQCQCHLHKHADQAGGGTRILLLYTCVTREMQNKVVYLRLNDYRLKSVSFQEKRVLLNSILGTCKGGKIGYETAQKFLFRGVFFIRANL